jgi:beta-lactamase superfamily II metal-dependent hydrolase
LRRKEIPQELAEPIVGVEGSVQYPYKVPLEVHCINSGQGNSIALRLPDGVVMVVDIDCSGHTPVDPVSYLQEIVHEEYDAKEGKYVRRLACAAFTHPHQDHISGLKPLLDAGFVFDEIWEPGHRLSEKEAEDNPAYEEYLKVLQNYEAQNRVCKPTAASEKWRADFHGVDVYCLGPSGYLNAADGDATNRHAIHNRCLILRLVTEEMSVLLPGDSAVNQWRKRVVPNYAPELLEADVLIASHHGSCTFFREDEDEPYEEAINSISPEYTVISVGEDNRHNHPHPEALKLYQTYTRGAVAQTKIDGSVLMKIDDRGSKALVRSPVDRLLREGGDSAGEASTELVRMPEISLSAKEFNKDTKYPLRPLKNGNTRVEKDQYILFTAGVSNRPASTYLRWEVKNVGVDEDAGHSEHYATAKTQQNATITR